jgi:hypothetical protein
VHRHGLTPAFSTRQESSALQAVLGNPIPLDKRILDDVKPGININGRHPALLGRVALQRRIDRFVVFFFESRDQFGGGQDFADAADALAAAPDFLPGFRLGALA